MAQITKEHLDSTLKEFRKDLLDTIDRRIVPIAAQSEKNKHYLFGNGDMGLDERIRNLEAKMNVLVKLGFVVAVPVAGYAAVEVFKAVINLL